MSKRYYIGLATSMHDSAIAIIDENGKVLFAEAAERGYQVKRAYGCPPDNIMWTEELIKKYCHPNADYVLTRSWSNKRVASVFLLNLSGLLRFNLNKHLKQILFNISGLSTDNFNEAVFEFRNTAAITMNAGTSIERLIRHKTYKNVKTIAYDHHLSHAGIACYGSPFSDAICLTIDGVGEGGSFSIYKYQNTKISLLEKQKVKISLGWFYQMLTRVCNFEPFKGEEWKVMGLAAYGSFDKQLHQLFTSMFYVSGTSLKYHKNNTNTQDTFKTIQKQVQSDGENLSLKANIAYNGQLAYATWMNELINNIHKKYPSDNLILVGGCALNSSHNGEILDKTPFKNLYIPSAPADDGCALGGALLAYYADNPHTESIHKNISPYLGSEISDDHLQHFLQFSGQKVRKLDSHKYETVARLLADGKIIGWVQGRAEYGPRALGNRSILADPRKKEIKDIINERVKFREEFRPFAPSILHEYGPEYFEHYQESHYMERTLKFKPEAIDKVPGVVHVDNTGRLQTVKEEWNTEFYHLIKAFHTITGIPLLLNTSFNVMGKPIIHTLEDALSTFLTTGMDALVINDYLIEK